MATCTYVPDAASPLDLATIPLGLATTPPDLATIQTDTEPLWEQLLQSIEEGRVIPVVGQELLTTTLDGRKVELYPYLAQQLAARLGLPAGGSSTLSEVTCRYLATGKDLEDVYFQLKSVVPSADRLTIPEPLRKLAALPFKLFVSVTFDGLLERAINEVRFAGQSRARAITYSPQATADIPPNADSNDPTVFHLFGKVSSVPDYAVTDEDVLEFMHSLQSETRRPNALFDALNRSHVLIVGSTFSGWLARFFFRITKRGRLSNASGKTDFVADRCVGEDLGLVYFLNHFRTRTKVFPGESVAFVDELHRRWMKRHPPSKPGVDQRPTGTSGKDERDPDVPGMPPAAVFLSYASEDRKSVEAIKSQLEAAGVDVWFDRQELRPGDDFEERILRNIDRCSLFVPVISRHCLGPQRRFFRLEWNRALRVAAQAPPQMQFIVPVALDDTPLDADELPARFRDLQWTRLRDGQADAKFVADIRKYYRDYHQANMSAA